MAKAAGREKSPRSARKPPALGNTQQPRNTDLPYNGNVHRYAQDHGQHADTTATCTQNCNIHRHNCNLQTEWQYTVRIATCTSTIAIRNLQLQHALSMGAWPRGHRRCAPWIGRTAVRKVSSEQPPQPTLRCNASPASDQRWPHSQKSLIISRRSASSSACSAPSQSLRSTSSHTSEHTTHASLRTNGAPWPRPHAC